MQNAQSFSQDEEENKKRCGGAANVKVETSRIGAVRAVEAAGSGFRVPAAACAFPQAAGAGSEAAV